jgi:hypothetical protein
MHPHIQKRRCKCQRLARRSLEGIAAAIASLWGEEL